MLNIEFKRNSQPIDDEDLRAVIEGVGRGMASKSDTERDLALLLSKLVLRIQELKAQALNSTSQIRIDGLCRKGSK